MIYKLNYIHQEVVLSLLISSFSLPLVSGSGYLLIRSSSQCSIFSNGVFKEDNYTVIVIDEGLEAEKALYGGSGKEPPALLSREGMLKQRLDYLSSLGAFAMLDPSHLGINFAKVKIGGAIKFVAELDGELVVVDGE